MKKMLSMIVLWLITVAVGLCQSDPASSLKHPSRSAAINGKCMENWRPRAESNRRPAV